MFRRAIKIAIGTTALCYSPPVVYYTLFHSKYKHKINYHGHRKHEQHSMLYVNPFRSKASQEGTAYKIGMSRLRNYFIWFDWMAWIAAPEDLKRPIHTYLDNIHMGCLWDLSMWNSFRIALYTHNWPAVKELISPEKIPAVDLTTRGKKDPILTKFDMCKGVFGKELNATAESNDVVFITRLDLFHRHKKGDVIRMRSFDGEGPGDNPIVTTNYSRLGIDLGSEWWVIDIDPSDEAWINSMYQIRVPKFTLKHRIDDDINHYYYNHCDLRDRLEE